MSLFWQSLSGYQHSSKKGVVADLGADLAMGEAKTLGTTSALVIDSCPSATDSACIVSIASCEIQAVNIRLQIVEEDFN
jgi:hypothetical protein